jgi:phosphate uptake regulator
VVQIIALRAPMADDLREVIAALKIVGVVERIGDYAKNIAKRVPKIGDHRTIEPISLLPSMAQVASEMVGDALNAFAARDALLAEAVVQRDSVVDSFYNSIFRTLVTYMVENPKTITSARTCCSSPRISSASATMPPMSPRWSIMPQPASICRSATGPRSSRAKHRRPGR